MLHFYQSNVITILNYAKLHAVDAHAPGPEP